MKSCGTRTPRTTAEHIARVENTITAKMMYHESKKESRVVKSGGVAEYARIG
jgi:hypothetical protein